MATFSRPIPTEMPTPHDALFKQVFSQPVHAEGELRHVLPAAVTEHIDWSTLQLQPGSFVDEELRERHADLLYRVQLAGSEALLYMVLEHKSRSDPFTPLQILGYVVEIWRRYREEKPAATRLPPVIAVVVHHGGRAWGGGTDLLDILDVAPEMLRSLEPYLPRFRFVLHDLSSESGEALHERAMTALARLALFCLDRARDSDDILAELRPWVGALRSIVQAQDGAEALAGVLSYIIKVQRLPPTALQRFLEEEDVPESGRVLNSTYDQILDEGRAQGRAQGVAEVLLRQLTKRFGELPDEVPARVRSATLDVLDLWAERFVGAEQLGDVFAD